MRLLVQMLHTLQSVRSVHHVFHQTLSQVFSNLAPRYAFSKSVLTHEEHYKVKYMYSKD